MGRNLIIFFFFSHTHNTWKFLGQGLNLSLSCNLMLDPLTYCTGLGIEPAPPQRPEPLQAGP